MQEEKQQCSDCEQWFEKTELCFIEDTPFCIRCMYGDAYSCYSCYLDDGRARKIK